MESSSTRNFTRGNLSPVAAGSRRVIEDPFFKDSDRSYFIQLADFCAYALLRKERPTQYTQRYGLHEAFDLLDAVLVKEASAGDPWGMGVLRVSSHTQKAGPTPAT